VIDWQPPAGSTLAAWAASLLGPRPFHTSASYNALNQVVTTTAPAAVDGSLRATKLTYDRAGALTAVALGGATFVGLIAYTAHGQPTITVYGNGLMRRCAYDPLTFQLARVRTERFTRAGPDYQPTGPPTEDLLYGYDLAGNIVEIQDRTPGSGVNGNPAAAGVQDPVLARLLASGDALLRDYSYDPLYRLTSATGRECSDIAVPRPWTDDSRCGYNSGRFGTLNQANARFMTTPYAETYAYDAVGDLVSVARQTSAVRWTRNFGFGGLTPQDWHNAWITHLNTGSTWASPPTTRLTQFGNTPAAGGAMYAYDPDGNLAGIATSRHLDWDHAGRLIACRTQAGSSAPSAATNYLYDSTGARIKKVTVRGPVTESIVYIGQLFEYFTQTRPGTAVQNNTLHVLAGDARTASIRVGSPAPDDTTPATKYVLADHLGTAAVTSDDTGSWVNREEFSPTARHCSAATRASGTALPVASETRRAASTTPAPATTHPGWDAGSQLTR
jgi:hypothetical protein